MDIAATYARNKIVILLLQHAIFDTARAAGHARNILNFLTARIIELWDTLQTQYIIDNLDDTTDDVSNREVLSTILTSEYTGYYTLKKTRLNTMSK